MPDPAAPMKEFLVVVIPKLCQLIQASLAVRSEVFQWRLPGVLSSPLKLCSIYWTGSMSLWRISLRREMYAMASLSVSILDSLFS